MKTSVKKTLGIVGNVVLWIFVAFCAFTMILSLSSAASGKGIPSIFGKSLITVQSDSMNPTFKKGDLIFDKKVSGTQAMLLKKGDVITFYADIDGDGKKNELNSHRIIDIVDGNGTSVVDENGNFLVENWYLSNNVSYKTQGDNTATNSIPDKEYVLHSEVVGVWTGSKMGGVGSALDFLQSSTGFLIIIVLPMAAFFIYELYCVISTVTAMKQKKSAAAISAETEEEIKRKAVEEYLRAQALANGDTSKTEKTENADSEKNKDGE